MSQKDTLNTQDWEKWTKNTFIFTMPAVLALLQALYSSFLTRHGLPTYDDVAFAIGAFYSAMLSSGIDLLIKYKSGTEERPINIPTVFTQEIQPTLGTTTTRDTQV